MTDDLDESGFSARYSALLAAETELRDAADLVEDRVASARSLLSEGLIGLDVHDVASESSFELLLSYRFQVAAGEALKMLEPPQLREVSQLLASELLTTEDPEMWLERMNGDQGQIAVEQIRVRKPGRNSADDELAWFVILDGSVCIGGPCGDLATLQQERGFGEHWDRVTISQAGTKWAYENYTWT